MPKARFRIYKEEGKGRFYIQRKDGLFAKWRNVDWKNTLDQARFYARELEARANPKKPKYTIYDIYDRDEF